MPPKNDREAWEEELKELTAHLAQLQRKLEAVTEASREVGEVFRWRIDRAEKRTVGLRARLARAK
jgi:hypothetical protein